jgi:peptide deformylase
MVRPILRHGDPLLRQPAAPVPAFTAELDALVEDMADTMYAAPGVGLAAPQIGVGLRVFVIDVSLDRRHHDLRVLINPRLVEVEGRQYEEEGCLSLPGYTATVRRPRRVVAVGLDRTAQELTIEGTGLMARALQHEMDHLDGTLYLDRLGAARRWVLLRRVALRQAFRHG